jgi:hypothetical protein
MGSFNLAINAIRNWSGTGRPGPVFQGFLEGTEEAGSLRAEPTGTSSAPGRGQRDMKKTQQIDEELAPLHNDAPKGHET